MSANAVEYAKLHGPILVELSVGPLNFSRITDTDVKHVLRYDGEMVEWLSYIRGTDANFPNSFHGCCFSMLSEKLFFVGSRHGQKLHNFLSMFDLTDRNFDADSEVREFSTEIDFYPARMTLQEPRDQLRRRRARTSAPDSRPQLKGRQAQRFPAYELTTEWLAKMTLVETECALR